MGPSSMKQDIYNVMTSSRELANYCQESVKSFKNNKISDSLNNFHFKPYADFLKKSFTDDNQIFFEFSDNEIAKSLKFENKPIHIKVIDYIKTYLKESNI